MLKVGLLCGVIAAMTASGAKVLVNTHENKPLDTKFIIELNDDIENISAEKAIKQQNAVFNKIKNSVNGNAVEEKHFTILNNALVVSANKEDLEAISKIQGVKHVTEDSNKIIKREEGSKGISIDVRSYRSEGSEAIDLNENASARTMNKPSDTKEGEGTLIAVLDNEFFLRGKYEEDGVIKDAYHHETYTALPAGTKQRLKYVDLKGYKTHAQPLAKKSAGYEGSLYFNNKVPFYYDYAGDSYTGGSYGATSDYNVESTIGLHGSHVSSIAGGNADNYKGIAPLAQLALMKVFTDVHSTPISNAMRNGDYSTFSELAFITALEDCITLGVDAINVSIGSDLADFEEGTISQRTLQKISDSNIMSAISAGNAGKASYAFTGGYGYWTRDVVETGIIGSFANNASTMSIASGQPEWTFYEDSFRMGEEVVPYQDQIVNRDGVKEDYPDNEHRFVELINGGISDPEEDPTPEQQEVDLEYVYVKGFGSRDDYKNTDVNGKIAVINRGKLSFAEKYTVAEEKGAKALIIINNDPTEQDFNFRCDFGDQSKSIRFPVAVCLFRDKPFFEANPTGSLKIKKNTSSPNKVARTVSDFSSDGATYDLDLKPEITTPGSNIKGAVWPQNKVEKKPENYFHSYEYFNGTSMAAPNYEGAMAVVLSKVAATNASKEVIDNMKATMDMRMMSTAIPMTDHEANGENNKLTLTSPRMQGAGMANIKGAYNTDAYIHGSDANGSYINKSKIMLRNNDDIKVGNVTLKFKVTNEGNEAVSYKSSYNVMRPATAECNKVLTDDYKLLGEFDNVKNIPGFVHYSPEREEVIAADGTASYKDVIKISKDIEYYENRAQYEADTPLGVLKEGMYYCSAHIDKQHEGITWEPVPMTLYQSIKDIEIAKVNGPDIVVPARESVEVTLPTYSLTAAQKDKIAELYESGTYIEGFVTLEAKGDYPSLNAPYLGFYSLSDRNHDASYSTPAVVEPFEFEKDPTRVYASDLVNDVAVQLLGKDSTDFGSMMLAGYAKNVENINVSKILTNDANFKQTPGFYPVGTTPDVYSSEYTQTPANDIYAGNPSKTNTLIVQQFVMRSVADNYFTITNKETGKEVYRSALEDMLFGDTEGKYALYKSHVDGNYLGAGYVAHRASAIIPLYDLKTKEAYKSGEYSLKFNYQLVGTGEWVSKTYTLHIDAESPIVSSISEFKQAGQDMVRITFKDTRCAYAIVGKTRVDVNYDKNNNVYYADVAKSEIDASLNTKRTSYSESRLFIKVVDFARGESTAIVHFDGDYSHFTIAQGEGFTINTDFKYENGKLSFIEVDSKNKETKFVPTCKLYYINGEAKLIGGNVSPLTLGLSIGGGVVAVALAGGLVFFLLRKKKGLGGKENEEK